MGDIHNSEFSPAIAWGLDPTLIGSKDYLRADIA
jgi:hypothetical protein